MPFEMTSEQEKIAVELFKSAPDEREGKSRLTVRFNPSTLALYKPLGYRKRLPGVTLLRYVEAPARTPTEGRYVRKSLTVRTQDGRKWYGNVKNGTDTVKLRLAPKEDETD